MTKPDTTVNPVKLEDMPPWWNPRMEPRHLREGIMYRDKDGLWRHHDGRLASRQERRAAKVKQPRLSARPAPTPASSSQAAE